VTESQSGALRWRRSSSSASSNCAEVSITDKSVFMRNSKQPTSYVLEFSHSEWAAFLSGVRLGEFDLTTPSSE